MPRAFLEKHLLLLLLLLSSVQAQSSSSGRVMPWVMALVFQEVFLSPAPHTPSSVLFARLPVPGESAAFLLFPSFSWDFC